MKALSSFLRPEFLNRVDEVITFNSLSEENFASIAEIMLNELKTALAEKDIRLSWEKDVERFIASASYSHKYGARNMRRYISVHIEDPLAEQIIANYGRALVGAEITVSADGQSLSVRCI